MPIIDLMAGLKEIGSTRAANGRGGAASKIVVDVACTEFKVNLDEPELARTMVVALVNQIRTNILAGRKLDGSPAKPLAQATIERREYRIAQGARDGAAAPRYKDKDFRKDVRKHYRERFKAPRVGSFNPSTSPASIDTRAVESGLLIASIAAEPQAGGTWRIFFANIRALTDRTGRAPVSRALGMPVERVASMVKLVKSAPVRDALQFVLKGSIGKNPKKGASLLAELQKSLRLSSQISDDLGNDAP